MQRFFSDKSLLRDLRWLRLPCLLSVLSTGCVAELEPDVGGVRAGLCQPRDSDPETEVSFSNDIMPLMDRERAGCRCHITREQGRAFAIDASGLELTTHATTVRGGDIGGDSNVIPGDPCNSILLQKVSAAPPFGARMPPSGPPFWSPDERTLLSDWIAEGAYDN